MWTDIQNSELNWPICIATLLCLVKFKLNCFGHVKVFFTNSAKVITNNLVYI